MRIQQTLEGGLRIDVMDVGDWNVLGGIPHDALSAADPLAERLGALINHEALAEDWQEFIVPDLDEAFRSDVAHVAAAVAEAHSQAGGGEGPLWITRDDAMKWYSALNQARLAIEDRHRFGPEEDFDPARLTAESGAALLRSMLYLNLQKFLLAVVMR